MKTAPLAAAVAVVLAAALTIVVTRGPAPAAGSNAAATPTPENALLPGLPDLPALPGEVAPPDGAANAQCANSASATRDIQRLAGGDRFATAACAAQVAYPDGAATVVLARGDAAGGYSDALAGTVLANAQRAPILLTATDALPTATRDELQRLGTDRALVLGGSGAVSESVVQELRAMGVEVQRVAGNDRAGTAAAIAGQIGAGTTAFVVNGFRPADALVAGAPAARAGAALLLVTQDGVPAATAQALNGVDTVIIVGGFGVVGQAAEARLSQLVGNVQRVAGASRDETAASVARAFPAGPLGYVVAGAEANLVDAIAAGWLAALPGGGPVLYAGQAAPSHGTDRYLRLGGLSDAPPLRLLGGEAVLGQQLVTVLEQRYDEADRGGPPAQLRGFWVHLFDPSLKSPAGIEAVLDAATKANLNTVYVQVARRHDAYYNSTVLPRTTDPEMPPDLDILGRLIPAAKARGLKVEAWFALAPVYHEFYSEVGFNPGHIYNDHGPDSSDSWMAVDVNATTSREFLDLAVPAVQEQILAMIGEVVANYDIDGVHLDYLRYDGAQWGYHPATLQRFAADTGRSDRPAPTDPAWMQWRRDAMTQLASRINDRVAQIDPAVTMSMAAIAQGQGPTAAGGFQRTKAYAEKFQDWPRWRNDGLMDTVIAMTYFRDNQAEFRGWHRDWINFAGSLAPGPGDIASGHAAYLNNVANSMDQLDAALSATSGTVLFSYQQDTCSSGSGCASVDPRGALLQRLATTSFAAPAPAPGR